MGFEEEWALYSHLVKGSLQRDNDYKETGNQIVMVMNEVGSFGEEKERWEILPHLCLFGKQDNKIW